MKSSRLPNIFRPNEPPILGAMTWTWDSERRSALASVERSGCGFCVVAHIVSRSVASSQDATCVRVSIGRGVAAVAAQDALQHVVGGRDRRVDLLGRRAHLAADDAVRPPLRVQQRRVVGHRLVGVEDERQGLEVDPDGERGGQGVGLRLGDDRRDRLADVAHAVDRQAPHLGEVPADRRRVDAARHGLDERDRLVPREDGHDAGHGARRRRVDAEDAGVGDRAAHEHRVRHPGQHDVAGEDRATRQVLVTVVLDDGIADQRPTHGRTL